MTIRKVAIVAHENYGSREIFTRIVKDHPDVEFYLFITMGLYYKKSYIGSIWKMLKESSFFFCFFRFIDLVIHRFENDTLAGRADKFGVSKYYIKDINSDSTHDLIKKLDIDFVISTFTMHIFKQKTIDLPRYGTIGTHPSILPNYRGLEVFFWAMANKDKKTGVSVFLLAEKIDAGKVFVQEEVEILPDDSVSSLYAKLTAICGKLLSEGLRKHKNNEELVFIPSIGKGSYFPMPTAACWKKFRKSGHKWF